MSTATSSARRLETLALLSRAFARTPHETGAIGTAKIALRQAPEQAHACYRACAILDDVLDELRGRPLA